MNIEERVKLYRKADRIGRAISNLQREWTTPEDSFDRQMDVWRLLGHTYETMNLTIEVMGSWIGSELKEEEE